MTTSPNSSKALSAASVSTFTNDEEFSNPLCIDDILVVCREFATLGWNIQQQVESILELGITEAIETNSIKQEALPHIKSFLQRIVSNGLFGEACLLAQDCLNEIAVWELKHQSKVVSTLN
jgi:hypothetical protein